MSEVDTGNTPDNLRRSEEAERIKEAGARATQRAQSEVSSRLEEGKRSAAETARSTADALDDASATLAAEGQETLAQATQLLADKLSSLGEYVENHTADEFFRKAQTVARQNPALFIAGGMAFGLALSRFLKATPDPAIETDNSDRAGAETLDETVSSHTPPSYRSPAWERSTGEWS